MKKLIFIGGAMGVGKTTVAKMLVDKLVKSVMLDGDWCWYQGGSNWDFSKANKEMVVDNICYVINNFLKNNNFDSVILCWVLHLQEIHDVILKNLKSKDFKFYSVSLVADENTIRDRLAIRNPNMSVHKIEQLVSIALDRDEHCRKLNTIKVNVSNLNKDEVLNVVLNIIRK